MKVDDYEVPDDLLYTKEHEWARIERDGRVVIGITDYAAKLLHDVVYVGLPSPNAEVKQNGVMGSVESIKSVSEIYSPFSGKVIKVNERLNESPELVNQSPYGEGWMVEVEPSDLEGEKNKLLKAQEYAEYIQQLSKR